MNTFLELPPSIDDPTALPMRLVRHRPLTASEGQAIWVLLNLASLPCNTQEIQITLRQDGEAPHSGWVIQIGQYPQAVKSPLMSIPYV